MRMLLLLLLAVCSSCSRPIAHPDITPVDQSAPQPAKEPTPAAEELLLLPEHKLRRVLRQLLSTNEVRVELENDGTLHINVEMLPRKFADDPVTTINHTATTALKEVLLCHNSLPWKSVWVGVETNLRDKFGRRKLVRLFEAKYNKATLAKVDWEYFTTENIASIRDKGRGFHDLEEELNDR